MWRLLYSMAVMLRISRSVAAVIVVVTAVLLLGCGKPPPPPISEKEIDTLELKLDEGKVMTESPPGSVGPAAPGGSASQPASADGALPANDSDVPKSDAPKSDAPKAESSANKP